MTKLEIARRQLGTALDLFLVEKDPVSVHVLACAGCEIAEALSIDAGGPSFSEFAIASNGITREIFVNERNRFWNAFKHFSARKGMRRDDSQLMVEFSDDENEARLFIGWVDYGTAARSLPVEAQVYNAWFLAKQPDHKFDLSSSEVAGFVTGVRREFPGSPNLSPERSHRQLRRAIEKWRRNRALREDPLTDYRPLCMS